MEILIGNELAAGASVDLDLDVAGRRIGQVQQARVFADDVPAAVERLVATCRAQRRDPGERWMDAFRRPADVPFGAALYFGSNRDAA